jgi:hypothetical protein
VTNSSSVSPSPRDFAFCQQLYFEGIGWIIEALKLDLARQREGFGQQWQLARYASLQSRATMSAGCKPHRRRMPSLSDSFIDEATFERKAVTLGVVKINPARRLYERLGFSVTREDHLKVHMRREPDRIPV